MLHILRSKILTVCSLVEHAWMLLINSEKPEGSSSLGKTIEMEHWGIKTIIGIRDMVLEVVASKALETYFVALLGGQHKSISHNRIRRLSIHWDGDSRSRAMDLNMQHVRSLSIFQRQWRLDFQSQGHNLLDQLDKFTLLRVLDLEGCSGVTNRHLWCACQLHLLNFLSLRGTDVNSVSPEIMKLEHLQTFDVRDTLVDDQLPNTITNLQTLERLLISNREDRRLCMWRLPRGLQKIKALRAVRSAVLGNDVQVAREVGELQQLQELDIYVDSDVLREFVLSLSKLYSLQRLNIEDTSGNASNDITLDILNSLSSPPQFLWYLRIAIRLNDFPEWIGSLMFLVELVISETNLIGDHLFDILCELPKLKSIWMQRTSYRDDELVARSRRTFPVLINLKVTSDAENPKVILFEEGSMNERAGDT
jgi:disease resistance protein RPM1